jgi:hypothetical protein
MANEDGLHAFDVDDDITVTVEGLSFSTRGLTQADFYQLNTGANLCGRLSGVQGNDGRLVHELNGVVRREVIRVLQRAVERRDFKRGLALVIAEMVAPRLGLEPDRVLLDDRLLLQCGTALHLLLTGEVPGLALALDMAADLVDEVVRSR